MQCWGPGSLRLASWTSHGADKGKLAQAVHTKHQDSPSLSCVSVQSAPMKELIMELVADAGNVWDPLLAFWHDPVAAIQYATWAA